MSGVTKITLTLDLCIANQVIVRELSTERKNNARNQNHVGKMKIIALGNGAN